MITRTSLTSQILFLPINIVTLGRTTVLKRSAQKNRQIIKKHIYSNDHIYAFLTMILSVVIWCKHATRVGRVPTCFTARSCERLLALALPVRPVTAVLTPRRTLVGTLYQARVFMYVCLFVCAWSLNILILNSNTKLHAISQQTFWTLLLLPA